MPVTSPSGAGMSDEIRVVPAVTWPVKLTVTLGYVPAVTPVLIRLITGVVVPLATVTPLLPETLVTVPDTGVIGTQTPELL